MNNGLNPQDIAARLREYYGQGKPKQTQPDFAQPKTPQQQLAAMPNADKLTRTEKAIYNALPGFTTWMQDTKIMGKTISERMEGFDKSLVGRAFGWLDIPAEGLERTVGLASQVLGNPDFDWKELQAAWYAGSLTGDVVNLPQITKNGIKVPNALPGINGLNGIRADIQHYMDIGLDPKEALAKARDEYYGGLGALALRAQINDMWFHVVGDPLNFITGVLKPMEALKVRSFIALTSKIEDVGDVIKSADKAYDLVKTAANVEDAVKLADEAYKLAQVAGDTGKITKYGEEALSAINKSIDIAKAAGKEKEVARLSEKLTELTTDIGKFSTMTTEEAAKFSDEALKALGKRKITKFDKFAIMMTGSDPLRPNALAQKLSKVPVLGTLAKAFELTPESKASELLNLVDGNLKRVAGMMINNPNAEADFISYMRRVAQGATGAEYGHSFLTLEGRTVQSFIKGEAFDLEKMFESYTKLAPSRGKLDLLAQTLGESPTKLLGMMEENPEDVLRMLGQYTNNPSVAGLLQELNPEGMRDMAKALKNTPYNREMFFAKAMDAIETASMRQAVVQFGVKERGVVTRWADALKSAESLAFLRLNPGYPIRNKINNDLTMISRGLFGFMPESAIDNFWQDMGFLPSRLEEALTPAQLEKQASKMSEAEKVIQEALKGGNYGTPEKVKDFFGKLNLGKLDAAGHWGQKIETAARRKAMTLGMQQGLEKFLPNVTIEKHLTPQILDELENVSEGLSKTINNAIRSSNGSETKLAKILGENLNVNVDSILDDVTRVVGSDVREQMGTELTMHIKNNLPKAIAENKVDSFVQETRQMLNNHIEDLFNKQIENVVEHVRAQAVAGGPNAWNKYLAQASDQFWGAHIEHSIRMPDAVKAAREAALSGDWKAANALWKQEAADSKLFYDRAFRRVDAYIKGLEEGAGELTKRGAKVPFGETRKTFGQWKSMWEDFFTESNNMKAEFWDAVEKGGKNQPVWEEVQTKINAMYNEAIGKEDDFMRRIDDSIGGMIEDPQVRASYMNSRDALGQMRKQDKEIMMAMREEVNQLPPEARQARWNDFWKERQGRYQQMRQVDAESIIIQQGEPNIVNKYLPQGQDTGEFNIYQVANEYGIPSATEAGARNDRRVLSTVNKYLPEGTDKYKNVADIPEDVARKAFEASAAAKGTTAPAKVNPQYIADVNKVIPDPQPLDMSLDMMAYGRQYGALDEIANAAKTAAQKKPTLIADLPENLQKEIMKGLDNVKTDLSTARYQAMKFGEWRADSALLNYNRRTNFDSWLGHVAPFSFWTTHSLGNWAVESIDRPAMLTNYMRAKEFFATAGLERDGMATRTKGKLRIDIPFAPEWMGEQFIDPLRVALPFDNWISPFENLEKDQHSFEGRVQRVLDQQLKEGSITKEEYDDATQSRDGATWDFASSIQQRNEEGDRYDAWDFTTTLAAPHAPIMWAYNAAFGDKQDIGPFSPLSRVTRNAATLLGVEDWNNSKYNLEAKVRRHFGLPAYDKWDDYRIKRAASNMAGSGELTPEEAKEAIAVAAMVESGQMTAEEGKKQSEAYRLSVARSNQEYTGGIGQFLVSTFGLSVTSVPKGENNLRMLQDDYGAAYEKYKKASTSLEDYIKSHPNMDKQEASDAWEKANPKLAKEGDALSQFFNEHPEYETRLGLFDKPEEQIHKFYIDQIWSTYNELPKLNQDEVREHLGTDFQQSFLNSETRSYDDIPNNVMQVWLKMMNTDPLGGLTADQRLLVSLYGKTQMTDPETAWRVQVFYDQRKENFEGYYDKQTEYYKLSDKRQKKAYLRANPDLQQYFDWRKNFMLTNPDLVPYLTDNEKDIAKAKNRARSEGAVPTAQELQVNLPPDVAELVSYYAQSGQPLPATVLNELNYIGGQSGLSGEQLFNIVQGQYK